MFRQSDDMFLELFMDQYAEWTTTQSVIQLLAGGTSALRRPSTESTPVETKLFDLQGRPTPKPQKGISIRNGKKVVVR